MNTPIKLLPQGPTAVTTAPQSFAETALRLGGKSTDEAQRTGVIDTVDDQVESLFSPQYQTTASPIHRAIWDREVVAEHFTGSSPTAFNIFVLPFLRDRGFAAWMCVRL